MLRAREKREESCKRERSEKKAVKAREARRKL